MRNITLFIFVLIAITSCKTKKQEQSTKKPIAKVYDNLLYYSDIQDIMDYGISKEDSEINVNNYVNKWIKQKLLLNKAELNLSEKDLDVSRQIKEYRTQLIINKYEQKIIEQKLDTSFNDVEIKEYYKKYSNNFKLDNTILKCAIIKIPRTAPDIWKIRKWFKSDDEKDLEQTKFYVQNNADMFEDFNGNWINPKALKALITIKNSYIDRYINNKNYFEISDSSTIFLIKIDDKKLKNDITPLELIKNNIKRILLTKRKKELIDRIERQLYDDAIENKNIIIYNK